MKIGLGKRKFWKIIIIGFAVLFILLVISFLTWAQFIYRADQVKLQEFFVNNKDSVSIIEYPEYWQISPKNNACTSENCTATGYIFYPGAKVDPQAYFYKLAFIVNQTNTKLFITKPPLHLAIFGIKQADEVIKNNPDIKNWILGGHSLGGAMACEYIKGNPGKIKTLILLGSYCASDLSGLNLKVIGIHGSRDGLLDVQKVSANRSNLPPTNEDYLIEGMNHAQSGNYGPQSGDLDPTKSDEDVQAEITSIITATLVQNNVQE